MQPRGNDAADSPAGSERPACHRADTPHPQVTHELATLIPPNSAPEVPLKATGTCALPTGEALPSTPPAPTLPPVAEIMLSASNGNEKPSAWMHALDGGEQLVAAPAHAWLPGADDAVDGPLCPCGAQHVTPHEHRHAMAESAANSSILQAERAATQRGGDSRQKLPLDKSHAAKPAMTASTQVKVMPQADKAAALLADGSSSSADGSSGYDLFGLSDSDASDDGDRSARRAARKHDRHLRTPSQRQHDQHLQEMLSAASVLQPNNAPVLGITPRTVLTHQGHGHPDSVRAMSKNDPQAVQLAKIMLEQRQAEQQRAAQSRDAQVVHALARVSAASQHLPNMQDPESLLLSPVSPMPSPANTTGTAADGGLAARRSSRMKPPPMPAGALPPRHPPSINAAAAVSERRDASDSTADAAQRSHGSRVTPMQPTPTSVDSMPTFSP